MKLDWTGPARADIRGIDTHVSRYSPEKAAELLTSIIEAADILLSFPSIGPSLERSTRSLRVRQSPYVLVYRIVGPVVQILRVRHDRQDWRAE